MDLSLPPAPPRYKSASQKARVVTERWAADNLYCPACSSAHLDTQPTNTKVLDFTCPRCGLHVQLKSKSGRFGRKFSNSAYEPKMEAILKREMPDYALLTYDKASWSVTGLEFVPGHFLAPHLIEKRRPLKPTAKRRGWVGSNVRIGLLPPDARIGAIRNREPLPPREVRAAYAQTKPLKDMKAETVGWTLDVLREVRTVAPVRGMTFTLLEVYATAEEPLANLHPQNLHVRDKIRQQLQVLRDMGLLEFLPGERGRYRILR